MFVIQRVLEVEGKLTLLGPESSHYAAPVFPTVFDDEYGGSWRHNRPVSRYAADQPRSNGPMGTSVATLNYLPHEVETDIVYGKAK